MILPKKPDPERWAQYSLPFQMANIGSEVGRTAKWLGLGNETLSEAAFVRALDLYDVTIQTGRMGTSGRDALLKELCRSREIFCEAFLKKDCSAIEREEKYFMQFAVAERLKIAK